MKYTIFILSILFSNLTFSQSIPENAKKSSYGNGWTCIKGFYKSGERCLEVVIPKNGKLNAYGSGWTCKKGFYKSGQRCLEVVIPKNGKLNAYGSGWICKKSFYKSGQECLKVNIPQNGKLNAYGSGWTCKKGFYKSGKECLKVNIPQNGKLNAYGSDWICKDGYKKSSNNCQKMTQQELKEQAQMRKKLAVEIKKRQAKGHCEIEYKTGAEVCVRITNGDLDCDESYTGNYYDSCEVSLTYRVETNYSGGAYIDADIKCEVEIEYEGKNTYSSQSDSDYERKTHSLYAHDSIRKDLSFDFSFSYYNEINSAKISDAKCKVQDLNLY